MPCAFLVRFLQCPSHFLSDLEAEFSDLAILKLFRSQPKDFI